MLIPPSGIIPSTQPPAQSNATPVMSKTSRSTIQYQPPFRWSRNPSLTDLRSIRGRLHDSVASSSSFSFSLSTASSGTPGIGYLSGQGLKWLGMQFLNMFVPLEIRRRRWMVQRVVKRIEEIPADQRARWLSKKHKIYHVIEDILELSLYVT